MRELFKEIFQGLEKDYDQVLVTIVSSDGSAPRKTGSQMLVGSSGRIFGTIGGGAVELRSVEMARQLIREKRSDLHAFRLHTNTVEDIGMICGGNVTALFQFIPAGNPLWLELTEKALALFSSQKSGWFIQYLNGSAPALLDGAGNLLAGSAPGSPVPQDNSSVLTESAFLMQIPVSRRVVIFGGGHISAALVPLLTTVGFRCWVFDCRAEYTTPDRFPLAEKLITGDFEHLSDYLEMTDEDYAVIMTNGHRFDMEVQNQILRGPFAYVGVIGSRRKTAAVNAKLLERGIPESVIAKVHTPIGIPIKAETPEEIAVSIAGELILIRAERREAGESSAHSCPM